MHSGSFQPQSSNWKTDWTIYSVLTDKSHFSLEFPTDNDWHETIINFNFVDISVAGYNK